MVTREPVYRDRHLTLFHGGAGSVTRSLTPGTIDAVVTDPPYELGFMGRRWDSSGIAYNVDFWRVVRRAMRPGAHLVAFGGTRTWHRMAVAIEDAGFDIRDNLAWLYGGGFPKSHNVEKAMVREGVDAATEWAGWGTGLKPAHEPIVLARKPLRGTVAFNVRRYGTGAINIDATRVDSVDERDDVEGRWPANVLLDEDAAAEVDAQSGHTRSQRTLLTSTPGRIYGGGKGLPSHTSVRGHDDEGGASRFFPVFRYTAKASPAERPRVDDVIHTTVKPLDLMRWLVRLVTPPGGHVLDPFAGSGTTAEACAIEGFRCTAIERQHDHVRLIRERMARFLEES